MTRENRHFVIFSFIQHCIFVGIYIYRFYYVSSFIGRPEPVVSWWIDGTPASQYIGVKTDTHVIVNRLELQHLKREDLNTTFKCRASNTNLVPPHEKIVRLELNRKYFLKDPRSKQKVSKLNRSQFL